MDQVLPAPFVAPVRKLTGVLVIIGLVPMLPLVFDVRLKFRPRLGDHGVHPRHDDLIRYPVRLGQEGHAVKGIQDTFHGLAVLVRHLFYPLFGILIKVLEDPPAGIDIFSRIQLIEQTVGDLQMAAVIY